MKASLYSIFCLIVIATLFLVFTPAMQAEAPGHDCSWMVAGRTYAFQFEGFVGAPTFPNVPPTPLTPDGGGGMITFLHNGQAKGALNLTVGSNVMQGSIDADKSVYSLQWDTTQHPAICRGVASLNGTTIPPGDFQVIVNEGGDRLEFIQLNMGFTMGFTARPMHQGRCDNRTIGGSYSYNARGWMLLPPGFPPQPPFVPLVPEQILTGFMPFSFSGVIRFHPNADIPGQLNAPTGSAFVDGWDTPVLYGLSQPRTYQGWYQVTPDCRATMVLLDSIGTPPIHTQNYVLRGGEGLQVVNTDPGLVLSFTSWEVQ